MKNLSVLFFLTFSFCQEKFPTDSLLKSKNISVLKKVFLIPIAGWQRLSYRSNFFDCQYFPSCSNYSAEAICKYGFFRGSVITADRITRCNPFALDHHLQLNRPFHDLDGRLIDPVDQRGVQNPKKSPVVSALLSTIIPGLGRIYTGKKADGIIGLWTFYLTSSLTLSAIENNKPHHGLLFGTITIFHYFGEIYGAWRSARVYQPIED